ncbi:hypothetical protein AGMMS49928_13330 [Spirochaetia bacterium]|nr:hypothetical protein AGMMS49928_13330 [Spirochaetia bacterium]
MRKLISCLFCGILLLAFISCSTTPKTPTTNSWIYDKDNLENVPIEKNEIIYRDIPGGLPKGADGPLFGKLAWFNSILNAFDLQETLSTDDKDKLFDALFGFLPETPTNIIYRAIALGKYFENGSPLILYAGLYEPASTAPEGSLGILQFTGNFGTLKTPSKVLFVPVKGYLSISEFWKTMGVVFQDGLIVEASHLYNAGYEMKIMLDAKDDTNMEYINLADLYINDQLRENDARALEMLNEVYEKDDATELQKTVAKLNAFLYYLYTDDVSAAEEALLTAKEHSEKIPDLSPSILRVINVEAPAMLELYKINSK